MYKSKYDWKYITLISGGFILCLAVIVGIYSINDSTALMRFGFGPILIIALIIYGPKIYSVSANTFYDIQEEGLFIQSGSSTFNISYDSMKSIHPVSQKLEDTFNMKKNENDLRVMTAFSGVAICLDQEWTFVKISPKNEEEFMRDLIKKAPHLINSNEAI